MSAAPWSVAANFTMSAPASSAISRRCRSSTAAGVPAKSWNEATTVTPTARASSTNGLISGSEAPGWVSLMTVVLLVSGIQLLTLGIVGEYVGKIYDEVRGRPNFIVADEWRDGVADPLPIHGPHNPERLTAAPASSEAAR